MWIAAVNEEQNYVNAESKKPHGPYVANAYEDVDAEEEGMEIAQTIDNALYEWYSERDLDVPEWKQKRDPDWWTRIPN